MFQNKKREFWFFVGITLLTTISVITNLSLFKVKDSYFLLNTKTGEIIKKPGIYYRNLFTHKLYSNQLAELKGNAIIQGTSKTVYGYNFSLLYKYDLNWVSKNKKLPEKFIIPEYKFESYMLNSSMKLSDEEIFDKKELKNITKQFYEKALRNTGIEIVDFAITSPIIQIKLPVTFNKN